MPCSPEKIAANRRNAQKSTGPKTEAGKARSRCNGIVHGLTGQGVALPDEDAAEVERRFEKLGEELAPRTERERLMARRVAFLSVRLERCEKYEVATLSKAIRGAEADFDDDRQKTVETWAKRLEDRPAAAVRELTRTPEGIDWMLRAWDDLLGELLVTRTWGFPHVVRAENLQGRHREELGMTRVEALSCALFGDFRFDDPEAPPYVDPGPARDARSEAARSAIAAIIEEERTKLRRLRASLSADDLARDRAEAPARRLFDPSDAAQRFRRYETAAAREMYRLFAHFDRRDEAASPDPEGDCVAVGSVRKTDDVLGQPGLAAAPDPAPIAASPPADAPILTEPPGPDASACPTGPRGGRPGEAEARSGASRGSEEVMARPSGGRATPATSGTRGAAGPSRQEEFGMVWPGPGGAGATRIGLRSGGVASVVG